MPNKNTILIVRTIKSEIDYATKYIFNWAELVKHDAELLGLHVIDLQNENATEENIKRVIEESDPYIIFLNGHGTEYSFKGKDGMTNIITRCKNDYLFKGRVVYALSCFTANILGKSSKNKGCECYIGYTNELIFPTQGMDEPLKDSISRPFMMISNEIIMTLIKGGTPEKAIENFHKLSKTLIDYWKVKDDPAAPTIKKYLESVKNMLYAPI